MKKLLTFLCIFCFSLGMQSALAQPKMVGKGVSNKVVNNPGHHYGWHHQVHHGFKNTPPGWHHGRKVGWEGRGMPPGQFKKTH